MEVMREGVAHVSFIRVALYLSKSTDAWCTLILIEVARSFKDFQWFRAFSRW